MLTVNFYRVDSDERVNVRIRQLVRLIIKMFSMRMWNWMLILGF